MHVDFINSYPQTNFSVYEQAHSESSHQLTNFNPKWYGGELHFVEVFLHCAKTFGTSELKHFDL